MVRRELRGEGFAVGLNARGVALDQPGKLAGMRREDPRPAGLREGLRRLREGIQRVGVEHGGAGELLVEPRDELRNGPGLPEAGADGKRVLSFEDRRERLLARV